MRGAARRRPQLRKESRRARNRRGGAREKIESAPLARIDYVELVDAETLQPIDYDSSRVRYSRSRFSSARRG